MQSYLFGRLGFFGFNFTLNFGFKGFELFYIFNVVYVHGCMSNY